jgi:hypothetical protein
MTVNVNVVALLFVAYNMVNYYRRFGDIHCHCVLP